MSLFKKDKNEFIVTIEVVPPQGHDPSPLIDKLKNLEALPFQAFSVASNPVAKPRMSALVFAHLIQKALGRPAILHLTIRDQNRLMLKADLWGAKALGLDTAICVTGDPSAGSPEERTSTVADMTVFDLITLTSGSGFSTGAVLDFRPETDGLDHEVRRLEKKVAAGAGFIVTQPVYDDSLARRIHDAVKPLRVPVLMGILPLLSYKHAVFLHDKVAGIAVPETLRKRMASAHDPVAEGILQAKEMLALARALYSGACIMPPFDRFEIMKEILD